MDIALYDFSALVQSMGWVPLLSMVATIVLFPLVLMALPALYNRPLKAA